MKSYKNYGFWVALSGAVVIFLNALGEIFGFAIEDQVVSNLIMAIAGVLIVLGVVNMPTKEEIKSEEEKADKEQTSEETNKENKLPEENDKTDI